MGKANRFLIAFPRGPAQRSDCLRYAAVLMNFSGTSSSVEGFELRVHEEISDYELPKTGMEMIMAVFVIDY